MIKKNFIKGILIVMIIAILVWASAASVPKLEVELVNWYVMHNMNYGIEFFMSSNQDVVCKKIVIEIKYRRSKTHWSYEHIYIHPNCVIEESSKKEPVLMEFIITPEGSGTVRRMKIESYVFYPVKIKEIKE